MSTPRTLDETLPPHPTPLLGRQSEVEALCRLLDDPACRLLTLTGPGGIGKTRLALEVAARVGERFADGFAFAALQAVPTADFLASAIVDALHVPLQSQENPQTQLLRILRDRRQLLVLDNFEHLLDGAGLLLTLLRAAPELTILATSREVLNLREEWLYPVGELDLPSHESGAEVLQSSAVQLFTVCARRVRHDFDPTAEGEAVAQICRLVAGMPLAIELAAAWVKLLPCAAIAAEIERNLLFLAVNLRDLPERHRSVRAAFDQSWGLLSAKEQRAFRWLAVFKGGFTHDAALRIAGAPLPLLGALLDKSLIRTDSRGRYQIHELLRQYAEWRLNTDPDEAAGAQEAHAAFYIEYLSRWEHDLFSDRTALDLIALELENVRAAWQWAMAQGAQGAVQRAAYSLWAYYEQRGPLQEGVAALEGALACLGQGAADAESRPARAPLLVQIGWLRIRQGELGRARVAFEASLALFVQGDLAPPGFATDPVLGLGRLALWEGQYRDAWRLAEDARRRGAEQQHDNNLLVARYLQIVAARMQGRHRIARRLAHEILGLASQLRNEWVRAFCFDELGRIAQAREEFKQAQHYFQLCYDLRLARGDDQGAAIARDQLAGVMLRLGALVEARQIYTQSVEALKRLGNRDILISSLHGLGMAAAAQGDYEAARRAFGQAYEIAAELQYGAVLPALLASTGDLLMRLGRHEQAVELLTLLLRHAASAEDTFTLTQRLILDCEAALMPEVFAVAVQRGQALVIDEAITEAQALLAVPFAAGSSAAPAALTLVGPVTEPTSDLVVAAPVERLTQRELEVLRLIGDGLSNQAIADRLVLSHGTIRWYTQQIYGKLGVQSRTQALARAKGLNLLA
jgi:predicted ATPase/DNA-binding NarL/FixJ family response regulator